MIDFVEPVEWLDAIAEARGLPRHGIARAEGYEHDIVVDLSTGRSMAVHMDTIHRTGAPQGYRLLSEVEALDFLDALRVAHGLPACDRAAILADASHGPRP